MIFEWFELVKWSCAHIVYIFLHLSADYPLVGKRATMIHKICAFKIFQLHKTSTTYLIDCWNMWVANFFNVFRLHQLKRKRLIEGKLSFCLLYLHKYPPSPQRKKNCRCFIVRDCYAVRPWNRYRETCAQTWYCLSMLLRELQWINKSCLICYRTRKSIEQWMNIWVKFTNEKKFA